MIDSKFQSASSYQYITDRLFLNISGFSVSCGHLNLRWSVLTGTSPCSFNGPVSGTLSDTNVYQTITGLTLQDNTTYKVSVKASDLREEIHHLVCGSTILVDTSKPQGGWIHDGPGADLSYQASTLLEVNWGGVRTRHGVGKYEWKVLLSSFGTNKTSELMPFTSTNLNTKAGKTFNNIADGSKATFVVRSYTKAGLSAELKSDGVIVDTSSPVAGNIYDGDQLGADLKYAKWTSTFTANWDRFTDPHSPISRYTWAIQRLGAGLITTFRTTALNRSPTATNLNLVSKESYCAVVRGYNEAGLYTQVTSDCVLIDHDTPQAGTVNDGHFSDVDYQSEDNTIAANWHTVTLVNGQQYCITIMARNKAGLLSSKVSSDGFVIDGTPPNVQKARVQDGNTGSDIDYQANNTALSAEWSGITDPESGIYYYEYGVSTTHGGVPDVVPFQNIGLNSSASAAGISLADDVYYFIVCAVNNAGLRKCISSDGVLVDLSPPSHGVVHDGIIEPDLEYQSSLFDMAANWEGIWDLNSGIEKFEWSIGTNEHDKTSIQNYTDVGLSTHVRSQNVLNLVSGTKYYVHLKVTNQIGAVRELVSDGVIADGTPPIPSAIYPGVGFQKEWKYCEQENTFYSATASSVAVYWNKFLEPESEVWYYKWAIGTSKCGTQVQALTNIGRSNSANTTMTDLIFRFGEKYYVTVISRNRAGLVSRSCSDALVFDSTPPFPGDIYLGQPASKYGGKHFIGSNNIIMLWDEFTDPESGIEWCNISVLYQGENVFFSTVSTASGNITLPRSISFRPGEYNTSVECINNAGLSSSSSLLFVIDHTPPIATGPILAGVSRDHSFQYQSDTSSITASWLSFTDLESGIENYYFAVGTQPYHDDVVSFEDIDLATRITRTDLSLSHGDTYFITVIAKNLAGLNSNVSSLGLKIDTSTPLAKSKNVRDGLGDEDIDYFSPNMELSAQWGNIIDPESGIIHSEYCLGTKPLGCQIKSMTSTGTNKSFTCSECRVYEGEKVYVTVRVTNGAGLSETVTSDGMLLDVSLPVMGDVTDGNHVIGVDYNVVLEDWNISMSWFGVEDTESGVRSCSWTIENNDGVIMFQKEITNNSIYEERNIFLDNQTYRDLHFIRNMTYYNVLSCFNKAELQATVRSDGFRVEHIWPIPALVRDGSVPGTDLVYLTNTKRVGANWDPFFADDKDPVVDYELAIGTAAGKEDVLPFTNVGLKCSVEKDLAPGISDLDVLEAGKMYYVTIKATTSSGLSATQHSNGFNVDPSPPLKTEVSVSHSVIDQGMQTVEISVSWHGVKDNESDISSCGYCLGTTPGACKSRLIPAGASTFGTIGPFRPDPWAEYYITVVVLNGAGLQTLISSKKLVFDTSPPSTGSVSDGLDHDIDFMNSTNFLSVQWGGIEDDETGVSSCSLALIEQSPSEDRSLFGNDTVVLTRAVESEGNLTEANLALVPGARYISQITCTNADGFSSTSSSDGVIIDVTPPNAGLVQDGSSLLADVDYQSTTTSAEAVWSPFDDQESGIMEYRWGLGTTPDDADAMNFTTVGRMTSGKADNLLLTHGVRYYATVEATNGAGMTSRGWSSGFKVDVTPPELTEVHVSC